MDEYIAKDRVLEILHSIGGCDAPLSTWANGWDRAIDTAYALIEKEPAADVAPVQHGKLIETGSDEYYGFWGDCPFCGRDNRIDARYCDNCGAKMDGGDEE